MKRRLMVMAIVLPMAVILTSCTSSEKKETKERNSKVIFDSIKNYKQYTNLSPRIAQALKIAAETDFSEMKEGKHVVDGNNLFYMIQSYKTGPILEKIEAHRKYIDIQFMAKGSEKIGVDNIAGLKTADPYVEAKDVEFFHLGKNLTYLTVPQGYFAIFWPKDAHMPGREIDKPKDVIKVVFKIKID
ncbi:MAG: YhcH/YjgK/YiaL family protein [Phycisphaerales bacterium]